LFPCLLFLIEADEGEETGEEDPETVDLEGEFDEDPEFNSQGHEELHREQQRNAAKRNAKA
jgi:hypothetical protein